MTLQELPVGEQAKVISVEGVDDISVRMMEMGLTPGVELTMIGAALFGDPLEIELRGYHLSLRKSEAERVLIARM